MGALPRPDVPEGPVRVLFDRLHELHHRAGWPSLREMAKEIGCSHTTVSAAFSEPRVPRWGLLELIVETLHGDTDAFHDLWLAASGPPGPVAPTVPAPAPVGPPRELPADVVAFTGRDAQLAALDELLARAHGGSALTIAAVSGTAGVGKTALAVHWAHRVAAGFPDGQLYINLRGYDPDQPVRAAEALEVFLRVLGVPGPDLPHGLAERAARYRTLMAGWRMLVLLDNAHSVEQVRDLLPGTPSCLVVVTSRDTLPALVARHGATRVNLDLLAPGEARLLLRTLIGSRVDAEPEQAAALIQRCARLPLALRIAAELAAARPAASLAELVGELGDESRLDVLAAGDDDYTAVRGVFSWSLRHLSDPAAAAFTLLGLHPGADVDRSAVAALTGTAPGAARGLIDPLVRAHLVDDLGGGRFGMHDLLHAYAAERATQLPAPVRAEALSRLRAYYLETARLAAGTMGTSPWLEAERANLLAVARTGGDDRYAVELSAALGPYLDARAHYHDALALHGLARAAAHGAGDPAAEGRAWMLLATVHRRLGDYRAAIEGYERALDLLERGGDRAGQATVRHGLGLACLRVGRNAEAVDQITLAIAGYREHGDRAGEGTALYGLGLAEFVFGRYAQARAHDEEALAVLRALGDRTGEGRTLNNLGLLHHRLGDLAAAADHYRRALRIAREVGNRAGEATALVNLGDVAPDPADARELYMEALALSRHIGYRVAQADALRGLGVVLAGLGRLDEALEHFGHAIALCADIGESDTQIRALLELGGVLCRAGRPAEAEARYRSALTLATRTGDPYAKERAAAGLAAARDALVAKG